MFVLYASERNWLALSRPDLPLAAPVVGTVTWAAFLAIAPAAECCLVAVPEPTPVPLLDALRAFRAERPFAPLVLVAGERGPPPSSLAALGELVRPPLQLRRLWPAMQRACIRSLLAETAIRAEQAGGRPPVLRAAVAAACRADPPIHSVARLAALAGCHRRTLWRHWRAAGPLSDGCALDGVLDWVLVLHACARSGRGSRWDAVAAQLGIHRHTLARAVAAIAHVPLRDLTPDAGPGLRAAFARTVLDAFAAPTTRGS